MIYWFTNVWPLTMNLQVWIRIKYFVIILHKHAKIYNNSMLVTITHSTHYFKLSICLVELFVKIVNWLCKRICVQFMYSYAKIVLRFSTRNLT